MATQAPGADATNPKFFSRPADFRPWMERQHDRTNALWVGFHKRATGRSSITWPESVDVALCYGWIDGIRKSCGNDSYTIRFTPRKPGSTWSAVNIRRAGELIEAGGMTPAGLAAFERRTEARSRRYSFEQGDVALETAMEEEFHRHAGAWEFFQSEPPHYRRAATWWVISAKREATRARRLARLIEDSAAGQRISEMRRPE